MRAAGVVASVAGGILLALYFASNETRLAVGGIIAIAVGIVCFVPSRKSEIDLEP